MVLSSEEYNEIKIDQINKNVIYLQKTISQSGCKMIKIELSSIINEDTIKSFKSVNPG